MVGRVAGVIVAALAAEATAECDSSTWLTNTNIQSNLFMVLSGGWSGSVPFHIFFIFDEVSRNDVHGTCQVASANREGNEFSQLMGAYVIERCVHACACVHARARINLCVHAFELVGGSASVCVTRSSLPPLKPILPTNFFRPPQCSSML
jgi:hypothetical protein